MTRLFAPGRRHLGEKAAKYCVCCLPSGIAKPLEVREEKERECTCTEERGVSGKLEVVVCDFCTEDEAAEKAAEEAEVGAELLADEAAVRQAFERDTVERRVDTDGIAYSKSEFVDFYPSKAQAEKAWKAAKRPPTKTRWYMPSAGTPADAGSLVNGQEMPSAGLQALITACSETTSLGKLVKLSEAGVCGARSKHFVHVECKRVLLQASNHDDEPMDEYDEDVAADEVGMQHGKAKGCCPRCKYLRVLLHTGAGDPPPPASQPPKAEPAELCQPADEEAEQADEAAEAKPAVKDETAPAPPIAMMCVNDEKGEPIVDANGVPFGGFKPSTKLLELKKLFEEQIPKGDKVIVFSFFKCFLDLVDAMMTIELGVSCGRFDGDCSSQKIKSKVLNSFRAPDGPRVLLCTIQSGGVGLNITIANWAIFAGELRGIRSAVGFDPGCA